MENGGEELNDDPEDGTASLGRDGLEVSLSSPGTRGGSTGRASASRSNGFHDQRFESRPEHKKNL